MDSAMEATAMAVLATATARGLPTPKLMPTTAMVVTARGLRTLRLMPTTAMEDMVDTVLVTPLATVLATVDTAMAVLATAMARGLLRPSLTMDTVELTPDTGMVDTDLVLAMATASKH